MALPSRTPDCLVPLRRVLPVVGSNVGMAAQRLVRGRLRLLVRTGLRIYVSQEDYLALCEAAWDIHVRRLVGARRRDPSELPGAVGPSFDPKPPSVGEAPACKPIHDGRPLDRYRKNLLYRLGRALTRWWRRRRR